MHVAKCSQPLAICATSKIDFPPITINLPKKAMKIPKRGCDPNVFDLLNVKNHAKAGQPRIFHSVAQRNALFGSLKVCDR